ncbi:MAG: flagellar hook-length control protein FliK, partial [Eubacterium sp.]|nr:flagellar hook-length control protein FliK [Eubacterium sp.]
EQSLKSTDRTDMTSMADKNLATFTENLSKSFEASGQEMVREATSMTQIVDQVVNQIKVRVMPETTSLEMQLHPESLGRVNIQVSAAAQGMNTAVITVENEMAKVALEAQMNQLKEQFDAQGLKVDAVEVTVAEFGFNSEDRPAEDNPNQGGGRRSRSHGNTDLENEGEVESINNRSETESSRRDVNSIVDYTA